MSRRKEGGKNRTWRISTGLPAFICGLAVFSNLFVAGALAQSNANSVRYPLRPVTIVVPFAAGGAFDILARSMGQSIAESTQQPVIVDNVSGAGGTLGAARVAKALPDGYTVLMGSLGPNAAAPALYSNLPYDPRTDFEPIILVSTTPMVLVARNDLPVKDLDQLIQYAQSHELSSGSAGIGSISHVALLLFSRVTKTRVVHVPYRSLPLSMNDLIGGRIDIMFDQIVTSAPHIRAGKVRALAVTSPKRSPMLPDIPTTAELGYPDIKVVAWTALFAPKATPEPIVTALNKLADRALEDKKVIKAFSVLGADIVPPEERTPAALKGMVDSEIDKWTPLLRSSELHDKK